MEKAVLSQCPLLVTISAPTRLAAERAAAAGLPLVVLARRDAMLHNFSENKPLESVFESPLWGSILRPIFGPVWGTFLTPANDLKT